MTTVDLLRPAPPDDRWAERAVDILLEVTESMTTADGVETALDRLARLALRATAADRCAIFVREPGTPNRLLPAAGASRRGDPAELRTRFRRMEPIEIPSDSTLLEQIWGATQAVTLEDAAASPVIPGNWKRAWGSASVAFVPLRAGGELLGLLAVDYVVARHAFTPAEVKLLEAVAAGAGVALRSAGLVEQLQRAVAVERRLSECAAALLSGRSLPDVLDLVADRFTSLLPGASCAIYLRSADGAAIRPVAYRGAPPCAEIRIDELPAEEVLAIQAIWERDPRSPLIFDDLTVHPEWAPFIPDGIRCGALLPLTVDGEILGIVGLGRARGPFRDEEVRGASALADQAAVALAQARLTEALQLRLRVIEGLHQLSDAVLRTSDLRAALAALNRGICAEVGMRCTRLSLADPRLAGSLGVPEASARERELLRRWRHEPDPQPVVEGSVLMAPVRLRARAAGVLWVRAEPPWQVDVTDLVRAIAVGLGEVAHKARLRRTADRRSQELAVAAERERIARDLHDTVGQRLYGIGLTLQDVLCDIDDDAVGARLAEIRRQASQGVADVRSAVYALSFLHVRERGLVRSLRRLAEQFTRATSVPAQVKVDGRMPPLPDEIESALFRVAHEALVNVERHARATGVIVTLAARAGAAELTIRDDGIGLDLRDTRDWRSAAHFGMRSMARSIEECGGSFSVVAAHPRGLRIRAVVPLGAQRRPA